MKEPRAATMLSVQCQLQLQQWRSQDAEVAWAQEIHDAEAVHIGT